MTTAHRTLTADLRARIEEVAGTPALDDTLLRLAARYAVLAPSSHNSQPWRFHVRDGSLTLLGDRSRALPVVDPHDRALVISCGAALEHLRLALRRFGRAPIVERLAELSGARSIETSTEGLAVVRLGETISPTDDDVALCEAIERRRTNRGPFESRPVPLPSLVALRDAVEQEGAWLVPLQEPARRHAIATLIAEGDHVQWHDPAFREELARWMRPNAETNVDGIPGFALGMNDLAARLGPWVVRTFDRGDGTAAHDAELAEGAPLLAVLGTHGDHPRDWLTAGEALARMLLRATTLGLAASFLNQPIEVAALRPKVRELVGIDGAPQLIVRLGYPTSAARATPRRAVEDVLI
jgi:nitroreductase